MISAPFDLFSSSLDAIFTLLLYTFLKRDSGNKVPTPLQQVARCTRLGIERKGSAGVLSRRNSPRDLLSLLEAQPWM